MLTDWHALALAPAELITEFLWTINEAERDRREGNLITLAASRRINLTDIIIEIVSSRGPYIRTMATVLKLAIMPARTENMIT